MATVGEPVELQVGLRGCHLFGHKPTVSFTAALLYSSAQPGSTGLFDGHGLSEPHVVLCPFVIGCNDPHTRPLHSQTTASDPAVLLLSFF